MKPQAMTYGSILTLIKATFERMQINKEGSDPSPFNVIRRDGWSVAQGKRMAKKARNVRRYRAACR